MAFTGKKKGSKFLKKAFTGKKRWLHNLLINAQTIRLTL